MPAYNTTAGKEKFHPKGRDNGYVLTMGGKRVYIAGDTEDTAEMRALKGIDVAFLPMNLPYTMSVAKAADAIRQFKPKIVYPYHYRSGDGTKADLEELKRLVGDGQRRGNQGSGLVSGKVGVGGVETRALAAGLPTGMAAVPVIPGIIDTDMLRSCFGADAGNYPDPAAWAEKAEPSLLGLGPKDNGKPMEVPE